jgi:hypothetical protein
MEWVYLLALAQEGASIGYDFHNCETLVWMFYGLRNTMKDFVVISWPYTKGSVKHDKKEVL